MLALEKYVANSRLEHTLYELVKTRASQINKCGYCLDMHTKDDRKAKSDIINEDEFKKILKKNFVNIPSGEKTEEYAYGFITKDFLKQSGIDLKKHVYVCGPPPMMDAIEKQLLNLKIDKQLIVKEGF